MHPYLNCDSCNENIKTKAEESDRKVSGGSQDEMIMDEI